MINPFSQCQLVRFIHIKFESWQRQQGISLSHTHSHTYTHKHTCLTNYYIVFRVKIMCEYFLMNTVKSIIHILVKNNPNRTYGKIKHIFNALFRWYHLIPTWPSDGPAYVKNSGFVYFLNIWIFTVNTFLLLH